jgi:hypothetical protein
VIDATERDQFFQLLRVGGSKTMPHEMDAFVGGIETALTRYHQRKAEDYRRRSAREDLRELFMLCADAKNIAKIRTKFLHLPVFARGELVHRARVRHPELAGGGELTWEGLYVWTQTCPDEELVAKLPGVIAAGRAVSLGQLRENGNTSAAHVEPMIMGEFLRLKPVGEPANTHKSIHQGGPPADIAVDALVTDLTLLWLEATGAPPRNSRSTTTPFGRLAHLVLGKAGVRSPKNALRRFWASVKHHKARPSSIPVA